MGGILLQFGPCDYCGYNIDSLGMGDDFSGIYRCIASCNSCNELVSVVVSHKNLPNSRKQSEKEYLKFLSDTSGVQFDTCPNCASKDLEFNDGDICPKCKQTILKSTLVGFWD